MRPNVKKKIDLSRRIASARERIDFIMESYGIDTPTRLSKATGVPLGTIKSIRNRDAIGPKAARQISDALGIPFRWVRYGEPSLQPGDDEFNEAAKTERTSVRERILAFQEAEDLGLHALASAAGISLDELKDIMSSDWVDEVSGRRISRRLGVEPDWFLHGVGPMQKKGAEIHGNIGFSDGQIEASALSNGPVPASRILLPDATLIMVPKAVARLSGGGGIEPEEGFSGQGYAFREDWLRSIGCIPGNVALFDVEGDSMEPVLCDGDSVLIDLNRKTLGGGGIYAIGVGGVIQIKRLQWLGQQRISVISENPRYVTYDVAPDELHIIGRMVWFARTQV